MKARGLRGGRPDARPLGAIVSGMLLLGALLMPLKASAETCPDSSGGETCGPSSAPSEPSSAPSEPASAPTESEAPATDEKKGHPDDVVGLWGRPVRRGGFHLQIGFGVGGGPDTLGVFHTMELGYTFRGTALKGSTIGMLHTFIQNKDVLGSDVGQPDLIGGWMLEFKRPLFYPDLVWKVALGLGGTHEQNDGKIKVNPGFGASYGVDLHFPIWPRFGPTLTLAGMNVTAEGQHHFGAGLALGVTLF